MTEGVRSGHRRRKKCTNVGTLKIKNKISFNGAPFQLHRLPYRHYRPGFESGVQGSLVGCEVWVQVQVQVRLRARARARARARLSFRLRIRIRLRVRTRTRIGNRVQPHSPVAFVHVRAWDWVFSNGRTLNGRDASTSPGGSIPRRRSVRATLQSADFVGVR